MNWLIILGIAYLGPGVVLAITVVAYERLLAHLTNGKTYWRVLPWAPIIASFWILLLLVAIKKEVDLRKGRGPRLAPFGESAQRPQRPSEGGQGQ